MPRAPPSRPTRREYIQTLNRLTAAKDALYKVISVQLFAGRVRFRQGAARCQNETGGVQQAVKNLAADGSIRSWAEGGAMAIAHVLDMFQLIKAVAIEVATPIERIGRNIYTVGALAGIAVSGSLDEKKRHSPRCRQRTRNTSPDSTRDWRKTGSLSLYPTA